ncbi:MULTISPECIES: Trp biosynthesis-associated membrane protein [Microbacterium]|uniref:Trp biosynthesis-associated membrane protein n=1 Tax=Microbacterium TaxID=33882 RepID=UPI00278B6E6A|nr:MULTISPECIES: Trp biosynthesis-associated membrane protein [Microbacterium]MDQ1084296.1 putative membrane protein (TIGR02234 family) [Microbacterium sp. SORGH_AS_0344]MDQ1170428.1 putative membrane protein (TIGR02234 family) [Microbacterium proteolyticum]
MRRARSTAVHAMLLAGAIGVIASTQTWIDVTLDDGAQQTLAVPGAEALPVLTPLSLAALALGAALSIVGPVLRYVFGVLGALIAALVGIGTAQLLFVTPVSATASTVTDATGISGTDAVASLVSDLSLTPWPAVTLLAQVVLAAASVFTILTARRWASGAGRKYRTAAEAGGDAGRPHDPIDSWDDLSRGDDPTA